MQAAPRVMSRTQPCCLVLVLVQLVEGCVPPVCCCRTQSTSTSVLAAGAVWRAASRTTHRGTPTHKNMLHLRTRLPGRRPQPSCVPQPQHCAQPHTSRPAAAAQRCGSTPARLHRETHTQRQHIVFAAMLARLQCWQLSGRSWLLLCKDRSSLFTVDGGSYPHLRGCSAAAAGPVPL